MVKQDIDNKPKMMVVEKVTKTLVDRTTGNRESVFIGIKCRWFDKNQKLQEEIFSSKDLIHI